MVCDAHPARQFTTRTCGFGCLCYSRSVKRPTRPLTIPMQKRERKKKKKNTGGGRDFERNSIKRMLLTLGLDSCIRGRKSCWHQSLLKITSSTSSKGFVFLHAEKLLNAFNSTKADANAHFLSPFHLIDLVGTVPVTSVCLFPGKTCSRYKSPLLPSYYCFYRM